MMTPNRAARKRSSSPALLARAEPPQSFRRVGATVLERHAQGRQSPLVLGVDVRFVRHE
jgi:hypothetical protein